MSSSVLEKLYLTPEETKALKMARKKRRITCREVDWWTLTSMVEKTVLDKVVPNPKNRDDRSYGWAHFKISPRGKRYLDKLRKREQENNFRRS